MLMQMHEMQLDHDPDIASIGITILIAPFGKIISNRPIWQNDFNRPIWQNNFYSPHLAK